MPSEFAPYRALYVHVPFCKQRCAYCDFETKAVSSDTPEMQDFAEDMVLQIMRASRAGHLSEIETVYIGGGTPSYLPSRALSQILYTLSLVLPAHIQQEWTMEANPDSVHAALVRDIWALGVNRLSLGVQSFNEAELAVLGRVHTAQTAKDAIACAQERFENISIDLICGIPGQSLESFRASLDEAIAAGVKHISVYPLTVEPRTLLYEQVNKGSVASINEDFQADCMVLAQDVLSQAGFARYEVASYAKAGYECCHNKAYWTGVPYLGLGTGAVSMQQSAQERVRSKNGEVEERLDAAQMLAEDLMLRMRTTSGVPQDLVQQAHTVFPESKEVFDRLCELGLAAWKENALVPTQQGWLCGNELYGALLNLAP